MKSDISCLVRDARGSLGRCAEPNEHVKFVHRRRGHPCGRRRGPLSRRVSGVPSPRSSLSLHRETLADPFSVISATVTISEALDAAGGLGQVDGVAATVREGGRWLRWRRMRHGKWGHGGGRGWCGSAEVSYHHLAAGKSVLRGGMIRGRCT